MTEELTPGKVPKSVVGSSSIQRYDVPLNTTVYAEETGDLVLYKDHEKEKQKWLKAMIYIKNHSKQFIYKTDKQMLEWIEVSINV